MCSYSIIQCIDCSNLSYKSMGCYLFSFYKIFWYKYRRENDQINFTQINFDLT